MIHVCVVLLCACVRARKCVRACGVLCLDAVVHPKYCKMSMMYVNDETVTYECFENRTKLLNCDAQPIIGNTVFWEQFHLRIRFKKRPISCIKALVQNHQLVLL